MDRYWDKVEGGIVGMCSFDEKHPSPQEVIATINSAIKLVEEHGAHYESHVIMPITWDDPPGPFEGTPMIKTTVVAFGRIMEHDV